MRKNKVLKTFILSMFAAALFISVSGIRIKTKEVYADDIFLGMEAKIDQILEAQKQMQADIDAIKEDLQQIKQKNNIQTTNKADEQ